MVASRPSYFSFGFILTRWMSDGIAQDGSMYGLILTLESFTCGLGVRWLVLKVFSLLETRLTRDNCAFVLEFSLRTALQVVEAMLLFHWSR